MKNRVWIYLGLLFLTAILIFAYNDQERKPDEEKDEVTGVVGLTCPEDYVLINRTVINEQNSTLESVCYNESPFGHDLVPLFQFLAWGCTIATVLDYRLLSYRMKKAPKLLYYEDKYVDELRPIPLCGDVFESKGFIWTFEGFDKIYTREDKIHVARSGLYSRVGVNLLYKGGRQKVTAQGLYRYLGKDMALYKEIMAGFDIDPRVRRLIEDKQPEISITYKLPYSVEKRFLSLVGNYDFGVDRFKYVIGELFRLRRGDTFVDNRMKARNKAMLNAGLDMSEATANISEAVGKTRNQGVVDDRRLPPSSDMSYENQQREEM